MLNQLDKLDKIAVKKELNNILTINNIDLIELNFNSVIFFIDWQVEVGYKNKKITVKGFTNNKKTAEDLAQSIIRKVLTTIK